jgi:hypothetical protein
MWLPRQGDKMKDLIFWGNQHGHGIKISGALAEKIEAACMLTGETPEEFVWKAIDRLIEK